MKNKLLIILAILLNINFVFSQVINPVTVTTTLTPPYSALLPDYTSLGSNKLIASIIFNDLSEPSWDVRLRITIESNQIRISTKPNFRPNSPITIVPGAPITVSGEELEPYLNYNNIDVAGISMSDLQQNGKLPEGYYTFCIEVYDYRSDRLLSNTGCAGAFIQLNGVPLVQTPAKGAVLMAQDPINIQFQWQLSTPQFYGDPNDTEYQLSIYKILDPNVEPQNSIANNVVEQIFQSDWSPNTTLVYGIGEPPLVIGQRYSYTVQAHDVQGRDVFKNDGFSEVGWFNYGYPEGGHITLTNPENDQSFTMAEFKRFQWLAADNTLENQQVSYHLKIVELNDNQDSTQAMANNNAWYEFTTQPQINSPGGDVMLDQDIEAQKAYAWQVTAHTGDQQIAKSPTYQFIGPPLIEWFWAGNHKVYVTRTYNDDLNNLSGKGKVKVDPDGDMFEFEFDSLQIVNSGGENTLMNGALYSELTNFDDIELTANYNDNGNAYFHATALRLNKDELAIQGTVTWAFPHAVNSTDPPQVVSKLSWINYDNLKLNGKANLATNNNFDLIDPANFRIELDTISDFFIIDNKYTERFYGDIFLPEKVKDLSGNRVSLRFNFVDNLYYFTNENITKSNNINLVANTELMLNPKNITVDLSETQSPQRFSGNLDWKGIYLNNFNITYQTAVDASGQMIIDQNVSQNFELDNSAETNAWITYEGLDLKTEHDFAQNSTCKFNTFESVLTQSKIEIEQSVMQQGYLKGTIVVPFLKDDEPMPYTLPLSVDGFTHGYIDDDYQHFTVDINPDKEKLHLIMDVKQAVFANNERLDLTVDLDFQSIQCKAVNVDGLSIWGDQNIGFGERNGKTVLQNQLTGLVENSYDITIDSLIAARMYGDYFIGFIGNIVLADDVSGEDGPTRFILGSSKVVDTDLPVSSVEPTAFVKDFLNEVKEAALNAEMSVTVPMFYIKTPAFSAKGLLTLVHNDPDWGDAFCAMVDGKFKKPMKLNVSCEYVLGKKEGVSYWFAEVGLSFKTKEDLAKRLPKKAQKLKLKKKLEGIPLGPYLRLMGLTGRVYHHMSNKVPVGVDCNMNFEEIDQPGTAFDIDLNDINLGLPDLDFCSALDRLSNTQKEELLRNLSRQEQLAMFKTFDTPNFNDIKAYVLSQDPSTEDELDKLEYSYNKSNQQDEYKYDRWATLFPNIDWVSKIVDDNFEGLQWSDLCNINLHWPSMPNLCEISEYMLDKILGELPPPDYATLENLDPDVDWPAVKAEYPDANWPGLREFFPDGGLCNLVMKYPGIDWGYIYIKFPELSGLPWPLDWKSLLPDLPDFDFSVSFPDVDLPDMEMPDLDLGQDIEVEYNVDNSVSYGMYLGVDIDDNPSLGVIISTSGAMEVTFNNSGGLNNIGLQLDATMINVPMLNPFAVGLGCLSYTPEGNQFVGDFFAEVKDNPLLCAHGHMHMDIDDNSFHFNIASKEKPVVVQPYCAAGPFRFEGFFDFTTTDVSAGLGFLYHQGLHVSFTKNKCDISVGADVSYYANIYAKITYSPDFYLNEAQLNLGFSASLKGSTSGSCGDHDFTVASVSLDGSVTYKHQPKANIAGRVSGTAEFLDIVEADVEFNIDYDL